MKKTCFIFLILLQFSGVTYSQSFGLYGGYGLSSFNDDFFGEEENSEQAGYIPIGAQILFGNGVIGMGVEVDYAVVPFSFSLNDMGDVKINQLYYGALAKIKMTSQSGIGAFLRGGIGQYTGKLEFDFSDELNEMGYEDSETDFKNSVGFNVGGGFEFMFQDTKKNGMFVEFVYHFVDRAIDEEDSEEFNANNYAVHVGFIFGL